MSTSSDRGLQADMDSILCCPEPTCNEEAPYIHITGCRYVDKAQDWLAVSDNEAYILEGNCEFGHEFEIALVESKGQTKIFVRYRTAWKDHEGPVRHLIGLL